MNKYILCALCLLPLSVDAKSTNREELRIIGAITSTSPGKSIIVVKNMKTKKVQTKKVRDLFGMGFRIINMVPDGVVIGRGDEKFKLPYLKSAPSSRVAIMDEEDLELVRQAANLQDDTYEDESELDSSLPPDETELEESLDAVEDALENFVAPTALLERVTHPDQDLDQDCVFAYSSEFFSGVTPA